MANAFVQVPPDSSGKQIDTSQVAIAPNIVARQRVVLADSSDPSGVVNVTNGALNVNVESSGGIPFLAVAKSNGGAQRPALRAGVDGYVQLPPDSTGKKLDTSELTVGGNDVFRQRIVLADDTNPSAIVTVTNNALNVNIQGLGGTPLNIGTPSDGDVLTYDGATGRWVSATPTAVAPPTYFFSDAEVLGGSGTSWTSLYPPNPVTSLQLFDSNGTLLHLNIDYHVNGSVVTTMNSYPAGSLIAWYRYTGTAPPVGPLPTVSAVSPTSGTTAGGTAVTITGTNFASGATVRFGGTLATNIVVVNTTTITATTPAGSTGAVAVMVTVSDQSGSLPSAFTYITPQPTVTGVSPNSGSTLGGTAVTITGTNFAAGATVTLGGTAATNVVVVSGTSITATTPAHAAGVVTVAVTVGGQSGSLASAFTYVVPVPTVGSVSPNTGSTLGGTAVTITGTNFASGATVTFGGTAATNVVVVSGTSITATTPAHAAGAVDVAVTVSGQTGTLPSGFTYVAPVPTVTSISPTSGSTAGGTAITITGTNFAAGATVTVGGIAATNIAVVSGTSITATTPAHGAGAATVAVTVSGQTGSLTNAFTYIAPPSVSGVSPNSGTTAGGTAVTISGANFTAGATVTFGSIAATNVIVTNSTTITATTPVNAAGAVTVTVTASGLSGSLPSGYTYIAPPSAPTVVSLSPTSGTTDGGTTVTITGTNFAAGAIVDFGSVAATSVNVVNSTTITANAPAWVGPAPTVTSVTPTAGTTAGGTGITITGTNFEGGATVPVTVTVGGLSGTLPNAYTYVPPTLPPPTVSGVSPTTGSTAGGTVITITGTNFV